MTDITEELRRAHPQSEDGELRHRAATEIEGYRVTFDLHWNATQRAIKRWQEKHPGNDLIWPDSAYLMVWLMEETERLRAALETCNRVLHFDLRRMITWGPDYNQAVKDAADAARAALTKENET